MLYSERLSYQLYDLSDLNKASVALNEIWQIDQDPQVMRYITGGKPTSKTALHDIFIPRIQSYTYLEKGYGMWRIALAETDECIGEIIIRPMYFHLEKPHFHDIELGWRFHRKHWGNGYATEAARRIMDYAISKNSEISHFSAIVNPHNAASIKVMKKLGMEFIRQGLHQDPLGDEEVQYYRVDLTPS